MLSTSAVGQAGRRVSVRERKAARGGLVDGDDQGWPNSNTRRTHGAAQEQGYLGKCQGSEATADGDAQHRVASGVKQARRAQQAQQVQQARLSSRAGRLVEMRSDLTSHHHLTTRVLCRQSVRAGADAGTAPARDVAFGGRGQWIAVCPRAAIASSVGAETIVMKITDPGWISVPSRGTNRRPTDASTHHQLQLQLQLQPGSPSTSTPKWRPHVRRTHPTPLHGRCAMGTLGRRAEWCWWWCSAAALCSCFQLCSRPQGASSRNTYQTSRVFRTEWACRWRPGFWGLAPG